MSTEKGFAAEYTRDGQAKDGSGRSMRDDPRVIILDDFSDYNGSIGTHINNVLEDRPRRWLCDNPDKLVFDTGIKFTGSQSLRFPVPKQEKSFGSGLAQWLDSRALRGAPMNNELMTGRFTPMDIPRGGIPISPDVKAKEGGYETVYTRVMMRYNENMGASSHVGINLSGGCCNRPNPGIGGDFYHPGSNAGYRSNGFDRVIVAAEPTHGKNPTGEITGPGFINVYSYGAEQIGIHGNHYHPDGNVYASTGGEGTFPVNRTDGKNGFTALPMYHLPVGQWFCMELMVKLNSVPVEGKSPGPNRFYKPLTGFDKVKLMMEAAPNGAPDGCGPQPIPPDATVLPDGAFKVWIDGQLVLGYTDVILRHSNKLTLDHLSLMIYFGGNIKEATDIWMDNIVVATEYIGPVNMQ